METYRIVGVIIFLSLWILIGGVISGIGYLKDTEGERNYMDLINSIIAGFVFGPLLLVFMLHDYLSTKIIK